MSFPLPMFKLTPYFLLRQVQSIQTNVEIPFFPPDFVLSVFAFQTKATDFPTLTLFPGTLIRVY